MPKHNRPPLPPSLSQGIETGHAYTNNSNATLAAAFSGGLDMECGNFVAPNALAALASGDLALSQLQASAARVLLPWFEAGLMEPEGSVYPGYGPQSIDTLAHRQLAFEVATQGAVLLQNHASAASPNGAGTPLLRASYP